MARLRIGQVLVQRGLLTAKQLEEALTAQQIYGGRLGTVIVEHGFVHEDDLAMALSRQLGVPLIGREALAEIDPRIVALVPRAVAEKFQVVPFAYDEDRNRVWLATIDPSNLNFADELQFALGRNVELRVSPEIVLKRALEKYYGLHREMRFIRLSVEDASATSRRRAPAPPPAPEGPGGVLGRIAAAPSTEDVLTVVLDVLGGFARQSVFLALRGEDLTGWSARGLACAHEVLVGSSLGLRASPLACRAFAASHPARIRLDDDGALQLLLRDRLVMDDEGDIMLLPLVVGDAAFGLFALGQLRPDRTADPALLGELMRRVGWRIQTLQLMERVTAPLAGCP